MARLRGRASETAESRGELVLHKLDRPGRGRLRALRGALHDTVDRGAGRGLDGAVGQGVLFRYAGPTVRSCDFGGCFPAPPAG